MHRNIVIIQPLIHLLNPETNHIPIVLRNRSSSIKSILKGISIKAEEKFSIKLQLIEMQSINPIYLINSFLLSIQLKQTKDLLHYKCCFQVI